MLLILTILITSVFANDYGSAIEWRETEHKFVNGQINFKYVIAVINSCRYDEGKASDREVFGYNNDACINKGVSWDLQVGQTYQNCLDAIKSRCANVTAEEVCREMTYAGEIFEINRRYCEKYINDEFLSILNNHCPKEFDLFANGTVTSFVKLLPRNKRDFGITVAMAVGALAAIGTKQIYDYFWKEDDQLTFKIL